MAEDNHLGTLIGETGGLQVNIALRDSFSACRGGFVRVHHQEEREGEQAWVLGRIVGISRQNLLFSPGMGEGVSEVRLLASRHTGESNYALMELIGYRDPVTGEIKIPRRPLEPGARVFPVDLVPNGFLRVLARDQYPTGQPGGLRERRQHCPGVR